MIPEHDLYIIGMSGGKDSTAAALWMWNESGIAREKLKFVFCDTQNEDPLTYAWLDLLRQIFPIETIETEGFLKQAQRKKRFPSAKARFCTIELKIIPTRLYVLELMQQGVNVCVVSGSRRAEGASINKRGSMPDYDELDMGWGCAVWRPLNRADLVEVWRLHNQYISMADCTALVENDAMLSAEHRAKIIKRIESEGPRNPLYALGSSRVGCFPCVMSRKAEIRAMAGYRPERIDEIEIWEESVGDFSSFFNVNLVPARFAKHDKQRGENIHTIATIRDVVEWSYTGKGARGDERLQSSFDLDDTASLCDIGGCE